MIGVLLLKNIQLRMLSVSCIISKMYNCYSLQVDAALVYSALRKSGLISNGCSGREIYLVYAIINNYANIFL